MAITSVLFFLPIFFYATTALEAPDPITNHYYWRDYRGVTPTDAVKAGKTINDEDFFIGQVYVHDTGLFVGKLEKNAQFIEVAAYGHRTQYVTEDLVKILCSADLKNFKWVNTTSNTFHQDVDSLKAIVGGYDHVFNHGILDIGLANIVGDWEVGSVRAFDLNHPDIDLIYNHKENRLDDYKVLVYSP